MATMKIAISMDGRLIAKLDALVEQKVFPNRSRAVQEAVAEKLMRYDKSRLAKECAKLDKFFEQELAEEGFASELASWPQY
jgi:metal-responsive CopG/Arc/MetJ family transcriptional regulator